MDRLAKLKLHAWVLKKTYPGRFTPCNRAE